MTLHRYLTILFCIGILCLGSLCQGHTHAFAASKKPRVGIFLYNLQDVYIRSVVNAIEGAFQNTADVSVFDARNDQTVQTQQIHNYLDSDVDAVVINLVDVKVSQKILSIIQEKNIPVIFFNKEPDLQLVKQYAHARYVGTYAALAGVIQGEMIAKFWKKNPTLDRNKDDTCHFLMLQGGLDNPEALYRTRISVQQARALGINMQQVGNTIICHWDDACAKKATTLALTSYEHDIDFIIANNDDMAIGAIQALRDFGYNKEGGTYIPVVGVDAIQKAKEAIEEGSMHGTVLQDAQSMGGAIVTMILNALAKKDYLEGLPYTWDESGIGIRIPYKAYSAE